MFRCVRQIISVNIPNYEYYSSIIICFDLQISCSYVYDGLHNNGNYVYHLLRLYINHILENKFTFNFSVKRLIFFL